MSVVLVIILCVVACAVGFVVAYFVRGNGVAAAKAQLQAKEDETAKLSAELAQVRSSLSEKTAELAKTEANLGNANTALEAQKRETAELQKTLTAEFENIANRVLKARADELSESSKKDIGALLNPLGEKINDFKAQVKSAYDIESREKAGLREQLKILTEQNARISDEANNLTKALKGDVKKQGNWGEMVLERVLEVSGLHRGREYEREEVSKSDDGANSRPDVVVKMPDNKHIIIDSKVSLVAYERWVEAEDEEVKKAALKEHLSSMKKHVTELADKNYPNLIGMNAPDFVMMFVPIEATVAVAIEADKELFAFAWQKHIVIVSPSTLLATLRTVSCVWKQAEQNKNAKEIARVSGLLYDKLVGFVEDFQKIKRNLDAADRAYDDAFGKLKDGRGNLLVTANRVKDLGANTNKQLPSNLVDEDTKLIEEE